jgi:hypothetical protein
MRQKEKPKNGRFLFIPKSCPLFQACGIAEHNWLSRRDMFLFIQLPATKIIN